jgi:hypothetical protein
MSYIYMYPVTSMHSQLEYIVLYDNGDGFNSSEYNADQLGKWPVK